MARDASEGDQVSCRGQTGERREGEKEEKAIEKDVGGENAEEEEEEKKKEAK